MRKTKIVCTIGPASENKEILTAMCHAGMNVARLNFSHGTYETHQSKIDLIKEVREELNLPIAIMLDTKGPEFRIRAFENHKITLAEDDEFVFTTREVIGNQHEVTVSYENLPNELSVGDKILVNNGLVHFEVVKIDGPDIYTKVLIGGDLTDKKSMSFPGKSLHQVYLSEQDKSDLLFGIKNDVDFVSASFVSCAQDLIDLNNFLAENGGSSISVIAKIENQAGIDNIEEICEHCDGIMIGRGDLGVEIPFAELPAVQKYIITKCRMLGKRVITATEMLESMINKPRPTRAEISDVANAVYDGTSAVMLSGESAQGKYPVETVKTMSAIVEETEKHIDYERNFRHFNFNIQSKLDAISHAICGMAMDVHAKGIVIGSISGRTARMVSRFRSNTDILAMSASKKVWFQLGLSWGVTPVLTGAFSDAETLFYYAQKAAEQHLGFAKGDTILVTCGMQDHFKGNTDTIKIIEHK